MDLDDEPPDGPEDSRDAILALLTVAARGSASADLLAVVADRAADIRETVALPAFLSELANAAAIALGACRRASETSEPDATERVLEAIYEDAAILVSWVDRIFIEGVLPDIAAYKARYAAMYQRLQQLGELTLGKESFRLMPPPEGKA